MSTSLQIEKSLLFAFADDLMDGHVSYKFGAKPLLNKEPEDVKAADCSGFVRYLLYHVSDKPRHVWMILNGQTIESHGRTTGPNRRPWDLPKLRDNAHSCFKLAQPYSLSVMPVTTPKSSW